MSAEEKGVGVGGTYKFDCFHTELVNCTFFPRRRRLNLPCKCHSGIFTLQIRPPRHPLGSDPRLLTRTETGSPGSRRHQRKISASQLERGFSVAGVSGRPVILDALRSSRNDTRLKIRERERR